MKSVLLQSQCLQTLFLGIGIICSIPLVSFAAETDALYDQARTALRSGDHAAALDGFRTCIKKAEPGPELWRALLGVALTLDYLEQPAGALEYYRRFFAITRPHRDVLDERWRTRRETIEGQMKEKGDRLLETHGMVSVVSAPAGASLFVDGQRAGIHQEAVTPFGLYLAPGNHTIRVEHGGHVTEERSVEIESGRLGSEEFALKGIPTADSEVEAPAEEVSVGVSTGPAPSSFKDNALYWGLVAGGTLAMISGVSFTQAALDFRDEQAALDPGMIGVDERYNQLEDRLRDEERYAWFCYGAGAVMVTIGLKKLFFDGPADPTAKQPSGVSTTLVPVRDGIAGQLNWVF
jgi:hypothetical protein